MTSFIYQDPKLISELLKLAQDPVPGGASADQVKALALKFVNNLMAQVSNSGDQFTATKNGAELSTKHLVSLPNLLNFLEDNGITSPDGHKLVIKHGQQSFSSGISGDVEFSQLDEKTQAMYAKFPDNDPNFQYYVYKAGLQQYVQSLQTQAVGDTADARVLRPLVGENSPLVREINQQLNLSIKQPANQDKTNQQGQGANQGQGSNQGQGGQGGQNGQANQITNTQAQSLGALNAQYPFLPDRIDFTLIYKWINLYLTVMNSNFRTLVPNMQTAQQALEQVVYIQGTFGKTQQLLSDTTENICRRMMTEAQSKGKDINAAMAYPEVYFNAINQLIGYVSETLANYKSNFAPLFPIQDRDQWLEKLNEQIGNSGSSLSVRTEQVVSQWIAEAPAALRRIVGK
jgi:hypothetical protein